MNIRDRITDLRRVPASLLVANPKNWRVHPAEQCEAVKAILEQVGLAAAVLGRVDASGDIVLIDGHLRASLLGDDDIPVLVLDVTEDEADKLLLTLDPLKEMAETNAANLDALLRNVNTGNEALSQMLAVLADKAGLFQNEAKDAPEEFPEVDENIETKHECLKCGYRWS